MDKTKVTKFAETLLSIKPDYPMTVDEITQKIETQGVDSLFTDAQTSTLLEVVCLLKNLDKGAHKHE